ncbi:hypothetical protein ACP275_06G071500 [Erythranthe tilingii]
MKAAYLFLVIGFLLLMHVDPTQSMADLNNNNPRYDRMLRGKRRSPPPPTFSRSIHQSPAPPGPVLPLYPPPPPPRPPPPGPPMHVPYFPPLHLKDCRPPPPPAY